MALVVDADHHNVRLEDLQRAANVVEVGQFGRLLPTPDIGQRQRQAGARGDMLEGAAVAVTGVAQADDQDLHAEASWRISRRSSLTTKPRVWYSVPAASVLCSNTQPTPRVANQRCR